MFFVWCIFCLFVGGIDSYRYRYVERVVHLVMIITKDRKEKRKRNEYYGNMGHYENRKRNDKQEERKKQT